MLQKIKLVPAVILGLGASLVANEVKAATQTLHFGIVPQQAASRLAKIWIPFMNELSAQTGLSIKFATMKDIPTFEKCLAQGAYDIAYMNPYHYTVFSEAAGYRAIAHQSEKKLKGLIVVRKDNAAQKLADLDNQKIAFPSPAAFGASVLPRAEMKAQGLTVYPTYVKSHDSVYKAVASGIFSAGGGVQRTLGAIPQGLKDQLRVIYRTNGYTPHAFAVNAKINDDVAKKIQSAMLKIVSNRPDLIKQIGMKGFKKADDAKWDDVRKLGLTQDQTNIVKQGDVKCRFD